MLAVSTINNPDSDKGSTLSRLLVFKLDGKGRLIPYVQHRFQHQGPNSMYFYMNFDYVFKGIPLIYAFQNEDEMRLDIFGIKNGKIGLIHSQPKYHSTDFSAIRSINGRFVSIDYDGVMRILEVPE
jgi:hypothetical protein